VGVFGPSTVRFTRSGRGPNSAARRRGDNLIGVRLASALENEAESLATLDSAYEALSTEDDVPKEVSIVFSDGLHIPRQGLPPALQNAYSSRRAQAMRMSTYGKPRIIFCADDLEQEIVLPRGCLEAVKPTFESQSITPNVDDQRFEGDRIDTRFVGKLRPEQESAVNGLLTHASGLLCAPTAFGKTVAAAAIIGKRRRNTLILVHRRQLIEQ